MHYIYFKRNVDFQRVISDNEVGELLLKCFTTIFPCKKDIFVISKIEILFSLIYLYVISMNYVLIITIIPTYQFKFLFYLLNVYYYCYIIIIIINVLNNSIIAITVK